MILIIPTPQSDEDWSAAFLALDSHSSSHVSARGPQFDIDRSKGATGKSLSSGGTYQVIAKYGRNWMTIRPSRTVSFARYVRAIVLYP